MEAASRAGRIIGVLIIMQMVGSGMVNFVLEALGCAGVPRERRFPFATDRSGCTPRAGYRGNYIMGNKFGTDISTLAKEKYEV